MSKGYRREFWPTMNSNQMDHVQAKTTEYAVSPMVVVVVVVAMD